MSTPPFTVDAFHRGRFRLVQPDGNGHRSGLDAMILAAAVPDDFSGCVADFGAGSGAAGLAVVSRCPKASAVLVERSPEMVHFAHQTLEHPGNRHLRDRVSLLTADVALAGRQRVAAGLANNSFDYAIMNPPFNAGDDRATPYALKKQAHVMEDGLLEQWIRSAAAVVRVRGGVAIIARPRSLQPILAALASRFGNAELAPVHPRADAAAIRIVIRAIRGSRAGLTLRPPLVLHDATGSGFSSRADALCNGNRSLFDD